MAHWTEELFTEQPELFEDIFEANLERTPGEVDGLLMHLKEHGIQPGRILDMNCGIGRHSVELGKRGVSVVGTDISPRYIEIAGKRAKEAGVAEKTEFKVADMRHIADALSAEKAFDGIINLQTAIGYYDDDTEEDILGQCLKLVKPDGFFLIDILNRDFLLTVYAPSIFSRTKKYLILQEGRFDPYTSRNHSTWTFLEKTGEETYKLAKTVELDHRVWSLHELNGFFQKAGWKFQAVCPGLTPPAEPSPDAMVHKNQRLVVIYRRP